jgi:hypothetical protein
MLSDLLATREFDARDFTPESGAVYIYGDEIDEQRTQGNWAPFLDAVDLVKVVIHREGTETLSLLDPDSNTVELDLWDAVSIAEYLMSFSAPVYLDITGLEHRTWAPIVKAALGCALNFRVVYVEPEVYKRSSNELPGGFWNLSDELEGVSPLPGFVKLTGGNPASRFVPLLGFEGHRLEHLVAKEDIASEQIVPVVGVPGFRIEYPRQTLLANRAVLQEGFVHRRITFAKANCPFDLFHVLQQIREQYQANTLRVALVGTKPHALGAVLYAIAMPDAVELLYDHPVRKKGRTIGARRVCVYDVSEFMKVERAGDSSDAV